MKALIIATALYFAASAMVDASTVVIDFEGGKNDPGFVHNVDYGPDPDSGNLYDTEGAWRENGFKVDYRAAIYNLTGAIPEAFTGFKWLQDDTGVIEGDTGTSMKISRPDGRSFSLSRMNSLGGYNSTYVFGFFEPESGSGYEVTDFYRPVLGPTLKMVGLTDGGKTVTGSGSISKAGNWIGPLFEFGPTEVEISSDTLGAFRNLVSLTLSTGGPGFPNVSAIRSFIDFGAPDILLRGLDEGCGFTASKCTVPGVGTYTFGFDGSGDTHSVILSAIEFDVGKHPAPVPIPASLPLLLVGLGGLGLVARRRR